MGILKLFNHVAYQRLLAGKDAINNLPNLPVFSSGDRWTIEYMALQGKGAPWEIIETGSYTGPSIGIFAADGTQLAFQNVFVADAVNKIYTGVLSCSDANFVSAVSALTLAQDSVLEANLEIKFVDSAGRLLTGYPLTTIFIRKGAIQTGTVTVAPTEIAATQAWAENRFAGKERSVNDGDLWNTPGGYQYLVRISDDGEFIRTRVK